MSALLLVLTFVELRSRAAFARDVELRVHADHLAARIQQHVDNRFSALRTLRDAWLSGPPTKERFELLASATYGGFDGFIAVNWIDATHRIRWVYPPDTNAPAIGANIREHPVAGPTLARAEANGRLGASPRLELIQGGVGYATYLPVYRDGRLEGFVNGVLHTNDLDGMMPGLSELGVRIELSDSGKSIFSSQPGAEIGDIDPVTRTVAVGDRRWKLTVMDRIEPYFLRGWADEGLLAGGLVLALCFFIALQVMIRRRDTAEQSNARYRTLVDHAPEAIVVFDAKTTQITDANKNAVSMFGLDRDALIGARLAALAPERQEDGRPSAALLEDTIRLAVDGGTPATPWTLSGSNGESVTDLRLVRLPGSPVCIRASLTPLDEQRARARALENSEMQLRRVIESTRDGVLVSSPQGRVTFTNQRLLQILARGEEDVLGAALTKVLVAANDGAPVETSSTFSVEQELVRGDGKSAWVSIRTNAIHDSSGRNDGTLLLVTDLTDRRSLEAQLAHAQKMEAIGRLAGGVAHDFNNLLMGILTASELLASNVAGDLESTELVDEVLRCGRRAATLTRKLLTFSRKDMPQTRNVEIAALFADVRAILHRVISEDIRLEIDCSADVGCVNADPVHLEQVLLNLAVNASDAMPAGGELIISARPVAFADGDTRPVGLRAGAYTLVTVRDTGTGIAPENLEKIFEPFFTTKGPTKGTGLGLATVHGTVTSLGGVVTIDSRVGVGTTFEFYLPESARDPFVEPTPVSRTAAFGRETILVVEDEESVRNVIRRALTNAGYDVLIAPSPLDAIALIKAPPRPLHLVLTDVIMPDMSGPQLAEQVRQVAPDLPFLFMSGYAGDRLPPDLADFDGALLKKPFTAGALTAMIRQRLDRSPTPSRGVTL